MIDKRPDRFPNRAPMTPNTTTTTTPTSKTKTKSKSKTKTVASNTPVTNEAPSRLLASGAFAGDQALSANTDTRAIISRLERQVKGLEAGIVERDIKVEELQTTIAERHNKVTELQTTLAQRDQTVQNLTTTTSLVLPQIRELETTSAISRTSW